MKTAITVQGKQKDFVWGPVVAVHEIGEYSIVEYHPQVFENSCGTGRYDRTVSEFHPYINGKDTSRGFYTLDDALMGAIFYKVDGPNTRLDRYMQILLNAIGEGE